MNRRGLLLLAALLVCLSCFMVIDDGGNGEAQPDQTTVRGTLELFQDVWNSGDAEAYRKLLSDDFTFYFYSGEARGQDGVPPSWGLEEEMTAFVNIFDAVEDEKMSVDVKLELEDVTEPGEGEESCRIEAIDYLLKSYYPERETLYLVDWFMDLELRRVGGDWVITDWWDGEDPVWPDELGGWGWLKYEFFGHDMDNGRRGALLRAPVAG